MPDRFRVSVKPHCFSKRSRPATRRTGGRSRSFAAFSPHRRLPAGLEEPHRLHLSAIRASSHRDSCLEGFGPGGRRHPCQLFSKKQLAALAPTSTASAYGLYKAALALLCAENGAPMTHWRQAGLQRRRPDHAPDCGELHRILRSRPRYSS